MTLTKIDRKLCVAPMMTHTDRHFRFFLRLLSRHVMLYTEMMSTDALTYGNAERNLAFNPLEHPVGIQLGGSDSKQLLQCAKKAEAAGYDEINLNIGCPSNRVQSGQFGACLMAKPQHVAECIAMIQAEVKIPVTVKTRIGIDANDSYEYLENFISIVSTGGCNTFIIHARKAWLNGLSPRQNREIPPLKYEFVHRIKRNFANLEIVINGGFKKLSDIQDQYQYVDGVMVGRAICNNPYMLAEAEKKIFGNHIKPSRHEVLQHYMCYMTEEIKKGHSLKHMSRHILGLYQGHVGAKAYRRFLSEHAHKPNSGIEVIKEAMNLVETAWKEHSKFNV